MIDIIHILLTLVLLSIASYQDLFSGKIKNNLNFGFLGVGICLIFLENGYSDVFVEHIKSIGFVFLLSLLFFYLKFISGGDGKLFMAVASLMGGAFTVGVFSYSIIFGALYELSLYILRMKNKNEKKRLKFAPIIFIGALIQFILPLQSLLQI